MAMHLFASLDVRHTAMASYHPQCNSQAEVCNKMIAKYLAAFVNESTLDWELYVPALAFAYNTSFHRSVKATPFRLTFGVEARLPFFFAHNFQRLHSPTLPGDSLLDQLHVARNLAVENNLLAMDKQKECFDKSATHHVFHEGQFVLMEDFYFLHRNCKLTHCYSGPFRILRVKGLHNVELLLTNSHKIIVNVTRVKPYFSLAPSSNDDVNGFSHLETEQVSHDVPQVLPTFQPPPLSLAHSRLPGRPRKLASGLDDSLPVEKKVLSLCHPLPLFRFQKGGRVISLQARSRQTKRCQMLHALIQCVHVHRWQLQRLCTLHLCQD